MVCFWLALAAVQGISQDLPFHYLGQAKGLRTLASRHCAIDTFGFFWIATSDGLVRYDGQQAIYFDTRTHPDLPDDQIGYVFCDSRNQIWVCTSKGLAQLDQRRILHRQYPDKTDSLRDVSFCFEGAEGKMYAISSGSGFVRASEGVSWTSDTWLDSAIAGHHIRDLHRFDSDRYLLLAQGRGVIIADTRLRTHQYVPLPGAYCVTPFDDESVLVALRPQFELVRISVQDTADRQHFFPQPIAPDTATRMSAMHMVRASDGRVYLTTASDGLVSIDSTLTTYIRYVHDPVNPRTIVSNSLRYIVTHPSGTLLVTAIDGVNYANLGNPTVRYLNYLRTPEKDIVDQRVVGIAEDLRGRLWLCMTDYVLVLDTDLRTTWRPELPSWITWKSAPPAPSYVERDARGNMWVSFRNEGVAIFNEAGRALSFLTSTDYPEENRIDDTRLLREGNDGYMYLGTERGLFRIRHEDLSLDTFAEHPALRRLRNGRIVDILTGEGSLWVSTSPSGAAWHYSFEHRTLNVFDQRKGLTSNRVYGFARDAAHNVYVGSYDGLSVIHPDSTITQLIKGQGLSSPRIEALEVAPDGSVWLANNRSVLKYDPATGGVLRFGAKYGVRDVDFAILGSANLASGKLAFGVNKGLIIVDPKLLRHERQPLKVFIFIHDHDGGIFPCHTDTVLVFPFRQRNLHFSFAVSDIFLEDQLLFRYRISSGHEETWSEPSRSGTIDFSPGAGTYTLEVQAFDGARWYSAISPVSVRIRNPWWRQWWFVGSALTLLVATILWWYQTRIKRYRHELVVTRQIADLESRALRSRMNPHFIFNCLNAIQECVVTGKIDAAYTYLSKFSRLLRLVLEHSDRTYITIQQELEMLDLYVSLEKLRFKEQVEYRVEIDPELDPEILHIPPMLIQPHLENAIGHGLRSKSENKVLRLQIGEGSEGYLTIRIEDNGVGRARAEVLKAPGMGKGRSPHKSHGIEICQQRLRLLRESFPMVSMDISDARDHAQYPGTLVVLTIPIVTKTD